MAKLEQVKRERRERAPTEGQRALLIRIRDERICVLRRRFVAVDDEGRVRGRSVSRKRLEALMFRGWVSIHRDAIGRFVLTDAGRAVLEGP